jgi:phosphatidylglycerol---prolipoprotein diacylglyceryl transferase
MAFPYFTDIVNAIFGTRLRAPIPTFGVLLMISILLAFVVLRKEAVRREALGILPPGMRAIVGDVSLIGVIAGFIGARVFYALDHLGRFAADPIGILFSRGGFTIYGGLLFGVLAGVLFLRAKAVPIKPMLDSVAPALMLAYAVGRLGCQLAGDGDWGIPADMALKPAWVPTWLWAQTYAGNVLGLTIPPPGVYPTPIYESIVAFVLFGVLLALRAERHRPGYVFSIYLLFAGFERLLIEKIRINVRHDVLGASLTQAELVSVLVILAGLVGVLATLQTRTPWTKVAVAIGVVTALTACATHWTT